MDEQKKILVVDDDKNIAQLLTKVLQSKYEVDSCYSLAEALELYDEKKYDLVITDLQLGSDSGMSLARYVRNKDAYVEVIIITGHASVESAREAIDLGVVSYLTKPIDIAELKTLVKRSLLSHTFNARSKEYSIEGANVPEDIRSHMVDILTLYNFISKLNQTVELEGTVQVLLKEISTLFKSEVSVLGVNCLGFEELYVHSNSENTVSEDAIRSLLCDNWSGEFHGIGITKENVISGITPLSFIGTVTSEVTSKNTNLGKPFIVPLVSYGESFGFIALFRTDDLEVELGRKEFYYAMAPLIAPPVYRGFIEKKTKAQAQTDGLTGIANRRSLQEMLNRDLQRAVRYNRDLSVIMMDIDNFKIVNDTYGHLVGDEVLRDLTKVIQGVIRGSDFFGRYGGEEFVAILPDTAHEGAEHLAERMREAIEIKVCVSGEDIVEYTVSVGVAVFSPQEFKERSTKEGVDWTKEEEKLLKRVDDALYSAKHNGKNCVVVAP